jgi:hypothetical protein
MSIYVIQGMHSLHTNRLGQRYGLQNLTLTSYFYKNIYQKVIYVYFYESIFKINIFIWFFVFINSTT